jgi:hypothetical protein
MKMTFQEIRIIATGPCIANQLKEVNNVNNFFVNVWRKNIFDIYVTEYGTALPTILPIFILFLYFEEGQTTQWPKEKVQEKFEDAKEVIRSHRRKKDRQHNPLCCLSFFHLWLLITSLASSNLSCTFSFGHCVVCPSSVYGKKDIQYNGQNKKDKKSLKIPKR